MKIISKVKRTALFLFLAVLLFTGCEDPNVGGKTPQNNGGDSQGQNNPPSAIPPEEPFIPTLTFEANPEDLYIILPNELSNRSITEYQVIGNIIAICEGSCRIPLSLTYTYGEGINDSCPIMDFTHYKGEDTIFLYIDDIEYDCSERSGVYLDNGVSVYSSNTSFNILNENIDTGNICKTVTVKFKYRGIESNELVFMFNQDLGNSDPAGGVPGLDPFLLPDITGSWKSDRAGLVGQFDFYSDGTGTVYSGNGSQRTGFNWRSYKDGTSNMCEISGCSWFSGPVSFSYSITANTLTTSHKLWTQGYTFTKQ